MYTYTSLKTVEFPNTEADAGRDGTGGIVTEVVLAGNPANAARQGLLFERIHHVVSEIVTEVVLVGNPAK